MIEDYKIVASDESTFDLEKGVNSLIVRGYEPIGGVTVATSPKDGTLIFMQAMVRRLP